VRVALDTNVLAYAEGVNGYELLSEDLQEGFTWGGVTVINPFTSPQHTLLNAFLGDNPK
jgi:predicted nucleic acid-binding protein